MYKQTNEYKENPAKGFWLETKSENIPAIKAYTKFGFTKLNDFNENDRILMTLI